MGIIKKKRTPHWGVNISYQSSEESKLKNIFFSPISEVVVSWSGSLFNPGTMGPKILAETIFFFLPDMR